MLLDRMEQDCNIPLAQKLREKISPCIPGEWYSTLKNAQRPQCRENNGQAGGWMTSEDHFQLKWFHGFSITQQNETGSGSGSAKWCSSLQIWTDQYQKELEESNSQRKHCSHPLLTPPTILHELKFHPVGTLAPRKSGVQRFSSSVSQFHLPIFLSNPPICLIHPSSSAASCAHSSVCARGTMQASAHRNVTSNLSAARAVTATLWVFLQGSSNSPSSFTRN